MKRLRKWLKRISLTCLVLIVFLVIAYLIYFPGQQSKLAFILATGVGVHDLQAQVDALEDKAIRSEPFSGDEKRFITNLYTCFAKGGKLTIVLRQSGAMMDRYLSMSGEPLRTEPRVFLMSRPVQETSVAMIEELLADQAEGDLKTSYTSKRFNMADPAVADSITGLYFGTLTVTPEAIADGTLKLSWRAEVPWVWPTYEQVRAEYGKYHARTFALPNARSVLFGSKYCLYLDDGLGAYLEEQELAESFLVYSQWEQVIEPAVEKSDVSKTE